jgi:hypothetical protein
MPIPPLMRRFLALTLLTLAGVAVFAATAMARTPRPVITSVSPKSAEVGQTLTLKGKNFARGGKNNRIYFRRASDGKTVRTRARTATTKRITVVIPAKVDEFLTVGTDGAKQVTRFQLGVFTKTFGPYTKKSRSPLIGPKTSAGTPGTPGTPATPPPPPDCDGDGTPDASDLDDDNDGLDDATEQRIGTNVCVKDTDGDGVEDPYEYFAALDLNRNDLPYPGKRPYPNPLDGTDADKDFDGDGMTQQEESVLWSLSGAAFGGRAFPAGAGQSFPYSDGNQFSPAAGGAGPVDLNVDGKIADDEKDADNDGLPNWIELAHGDAKPPTSSSTQDPAQPCTFSSDKRYTTCTLSDTVTTVTVPNGNTFTNITATAIGTPPPAFWFQLDMTNADSDGDVNLNDGADDQDHDGSSNLTELGNATNPVDPCDPDPHSPSCPQHA